MNLREFAKALEESSDFRVDVLGEYGDEEIASAELFPEQGTVVFQLGSGGSIVLAYLSESSES